MDIFFLFFFFKQKTAYEIKECDWSSDVCSSDLALDIDPAITNAVQYIQKIVVTSDGTASGTPVVTMNSGAALEVNGT